jgi:type I restriction enzyme, S subunit
MSEWKKYKLGELGQVFTGNIPSSKYPDAERNLFEKGITELKNRVLPANSMLVTCIGSDM